MNTRLYYLFTFFHIFLLSHILYIHFIISSHHIHQFYILRLDSTDGLAGAFSLVNIMVPSSNSAVSMLQLAFVIGNHGYGNKNIAIDLRRLFRIITYLNHTNLLLYQDNLVMFHIIRTPPDCLVPSTRTSIFKKIYTSNL